MRGLSKEDSGCPATNLRRVVALGCVLEGAVLVFDGAGDFKPATFFQVFSVQDSFSSSQSYVGFDLVGGGHCLDELGGISLGARLAISITAIIAVAAILRIR